MRRIATSLIFLSILIVSGFGVSNMFITHLARKRAKEFGSESAHYNSGCEIITLDTNEFAKLNTLEISDNIIEIVYQGKRFDIYDKEIKNGKVVLLAREDKLETEFHTAYAEKKSSSEKVIRLKPVYNFQFFYEDVIHQPDAPVKTSFFTHEELIMSSEFINIFSPPPDQIAA